MEVRIGTSGWSYDEWKGAFYPEKMKKGEYLEYYARSFSTVEINSTFYRLPFANFVKSWDVRVPEDFVYSVKLFGKITHRKYLVADEECQEQIDRFFARFSVMEDKIRIVLIQTPPNFKFDRNRISDFVKMLPKRYDYALECRSKDCFSQGYVDFCLESGLIPVGVSSPNYDFIPEHKELTTLYFRFHGRQVWYQYQYLENELRDFADKFQAGNFERYFIYFNNTYHGYAVDNARSFRRMMEQ